MHQAESLNPLMLAAIVYDDGVAIDALIECFATELSAVPLRIGGVLQVPPHGPGCGPRRPLCVRDVATGEIIPICQDLGPGSASCALDPHGLAEAAMRLRRAADEDLDLIFVSKFGRQEAAGRGFREEIALAALSGKPVLTAVKRGLTGNWFAFTGGTGTLLDARLWVLRDWWRSVLRCTGARKRHAPARLP